MLKTIVNFILFQIFDKAPFFLGLVAMIGLILQKKKATEVIDGVVKTVIGLLVLSVGSATLLGAMNPIMTKT